MDDKTVEELQFHQQTVESDQNSPLHLIREKEIEISGRVLRAKREADEIIAEARRQAAEIVGAAENEGSDAVQGRREAVEAEEERARVGAVRLEDGEVGHDGSPRPCTQGRGSG